jgi:hypothetical protein
VDRFAAGQPSCKMHSFFRLKVAWHSREPHLTA